MKAAEMRQKNKEELENLLHDLLLDALRYRTQKAVAEFKQTHLFKQGKRDIARIKTVLTEMAGK